MIRKITWPEVMVAVSQLKIHIEKSFGIIERINLKVYGVPRGGCVIASLIGTPVDDPKDATIIVDDLLDSGNTRLKYKALYPDKPFYSLFVKENDKWHQFPWEESPETDVEENVVRLLQYIHESPDREGLKETPKRFLKMLQQVTTPPLFKFTTFENDAKTDEMVIIKDIPFYSMCEHHMVPFFGTAYIAYLPTDKIVGISKIPRTLEHFSRRLQNQERITQQVAEYLRDKLNPKGVAVVLKARHLCMEMRGVQKTGAETVTSAMLGAFKTEMNCRQEFLNLIK